MLEGKAMKVKVSVLVSSSGYLITATCYIWNVAKYRIDVAIWVHYTTVV